MKVRTTDVEQRLDSTRAWSQISVDRSDELMQGLALVGCVDSDKATFWAWGSGFITSKAKGQHGVPLVVVCTAAHVLTHCEAELIPSVKRHGSNPFAPDPGETLFNRGHLDGIVVFLWNGSGFSVHEVVDGAMNRHIDLAYLVGKATNFTSDLSVQRSVFSINSDQLEVGTSVVAIGCPLFDADRPKPVKLPIVEGNQVRNVDALHHKARMGMDFRRGRISAVLRRTHLLSMPAYKATMSAPGGMSGGPVVALSKDGTFTRSAIGVLSHDLPPEQQPHKYSEPGQSYVIPAAWVHALPAPSKDKQRFIRLSDRGLVRDVGQRANELVVTCDASRGQISLQRRKL